MEYDHFLTDCKSSVHSGSTKKNNKDTNKIEELFIDFILFFN